MSLTVLFRPATEPSPEADRPPLRPSGALPGNPLARILAVLSVACGLLLGGVTAANAAVCLTCDNTPPPTCPVCNPEPPGSGPVKDKDKDDRDHKKANKKYDRDDDRDHKKTSKKYDRDDDRDHKKANKKYDRDDD
ncbi:hypothetical protein [Arthrobacter sp. PAMC25284]|uniref:hypothetical protein n=1 Tax=Arthrobacter sp. PAMC25284 TaxID=2861279 RepID=UPI001C634634|nr:hypothetical protein [Arthrobacter sp. PAMC25284]QYF88470.1 hypothetical protein KY499_09215 [Arthrobacter sp. PAMC25284]